MINIQKLILISSTCLALTACELTTDVGGGNSSNLNVLTVKTASATLAQKTASISFDAATKNGTLTYDGNSYSGLVKDNNAVYNGTSGSKTIAVKSINTGTDSGLWLASLADSSDNSKNLSFVVYGAPTTDLPTGKSKYFGAFYGRFHAKDGSGATVTNTASLNLDVDFTTGSVSGKTSAHNDANFNTVLGHIEFSNATVSGGKVTMDLATKGDLIANLGLADGSASGKGEALFYANNNGGFAKANDMIGTGTLENTSTAGVVGFSTIYHPSN